MQAISKYARGQSRKTVDWTVELAPEGWTEVYQADATNVSLGGLGLRGAMLPEVGQKMVCRFTVPGSSDVCTADGEVVWATDTPRRAETSEMDLRGSFGLQFAKLNPTVEAVLRTFAGDGAKLQHRPAQKAVVTLQRHNVALEGEVLTRAGSRIRIEQPLPMLARNEVATLALENTTSKATLTDVSLRVVDGMPRMVMELLLQEDSGEFPIETARPPETLFAAAPSVEILSTTGNEADRTLDDTHSQEHAVSAEASVDAEAPSAWLTENAEVSLRDASLDALGPPTSVTSEASLSEGAEVHVAAEAATALDPSLSDDSDVGSEFAPQAQHRVGWLRQTAVATAKMFGRALRKPAATPATLDAATAEVGSAASLLNAKIGAPVSVAQTRRAMQDAIREQDARRDQEPSTFDGPGQDTQTNATPIWKQAVGFAALVACGYAGSSWLASPSDEPVPGAALERSSSLAVAQPDLANAAQIGTAPLHMDEVGNASASPPEPQPAVNTDVDTTAPSATAAPAPSSAIGSVLTGGMVFGNEQVPNATTTVLNFNGPISRIEGERLDDGFNVTVFGAICQDRAFPIAEANAQVDRATVLNGNNEAELFVRFVPGRESPYQIHANGSRLEVRIGH